MNAFLQFVYEPLKLPNQKEYEEAYISYQSSIGSYKSQSPPRTYKGEPSNMIKGGDGNVVMKDTSRRVPWKWNNHRSMIN
jgi:hypothetical protein